MFKFFRKIRLGSISKNRLGKYIIYAIGEIILVVIGILIALNLNNRNEQRKTEAKIELIFAEIMEELVSDIEATEMPMEHFAQRDSTIYLILSNQVTYDDYKNNTLPQINSMLNWHNNVDLTQNAYDNLIRNLDAVPIKFKPVIKDLNKLYGYYKDFLKDSDKKLAEFINEGYSFGSQNYSWFYTENESQFNESIKFKLENFRYKNDIYEYRGLGIGNQLRWSIIYRQRAIECYKKIAELLNKPLDHESFTFNPEIAEMLVGEWHIVGQPELITTHFIKDKRLYGKDKSNREWEIFYVSKNKIVDTDLDYATIVKENGKTILKFNGISMIKKD